jgi:hypothetical protein
MDMGMYQVGDTGLGGGEGRGWGRAGIGVG